MKTIRTAIILCVIAATTILTSASAENTVLVLAGLGSQTCFPANSLPKTLNLTYKYSYMAITDTGNVLDQPFPKNIDGLKGIKVIVMADVPISVMNGFMGTRTLHRFVEEGGGLLIFGGPFSLGKGGISGSALEPALPITTTGPWDLVKSKSPAVKVEKSQITDGLRWDENPVVCYYQKVIPAAGAETVLECDGSPVLMTGKSGKGKVAVFSGTYLGEPAKGNVLLYEWSGYPELLTRIVQWLLNRAE